MGYNWSKYAAGVVPKQQCVGLHTVLLRRPERWGSRPRTVCMVSYVSPAVALLVEGAPGLAVGDYAICCTFGTRREHSLRLT
jgi:hypothetical protein